MTAVAPPPPIDGADGLIDVHQHFFSPGQLAREAAASRAQHITPQRRILEWTPRRALEEMDAAGVTRAIGSISTPGVWSGDPEKATEFAREWNDHAAAMAADRPTRFGFFATSPWPAVDAALGELTRAYDQLGAQGLGVFTNYDGAYLGDPAFAPLLAELDRRSAVVFVHPTAPAYPAPLPDVMPQLIEFSFETARTIVSLLLAGAVVRYPRIRWIFSHSGGALPMLADRLERLLDQPAYADRLPHGFRSAVSGFHFDSAGMSSRASADMVRALAAPGRILFGSDAPFVSAAKGVAALGVAGYDEAERAHVRHGAARLLFAPPPQATAGAERNGA